MSTKHSLVGYVFDVENKVWHKPEFTGIEYNDGDEIETRIAGIIKEAQDISILSTELKLHCTDWPSLYHLSGQRANILRPLEDRLNGSNVLEIGSGCGAITRYLGECGANVLALEGSLRRASITRSRTRDLENISVVSDSFNEFKTEQKFDIITLIGVLEYANLFISGDTPTLSMLKKVKGMLKPEGLLVIAIENQLGLKYFAGAPEDHLGKPMYGIENRYLKNQPQTFGRHELDGLLNSSGFSRNQFMAPYPDYKFPTSIITEQGFKASNFDAAAFAWQNVNNDPQLPQRLTFDPTLVWPTLAKNELSLDLSNSFLIIASRENTSSTLSNTLAIHFSTQRKEDYCKTTTFVCSDSNEVIVEYKLLSKKEKNINNNLISFHVPAQAEYYLGLPLSFELIRVLATDGWNTEKIVEFFRKYLTILADIALKNNIEIDSKNHKSLISGSFIDVIPQNMMLSGSNVYLIDKEWELLEPIPLGFLIFRPLMQIIGSSIGGQIPASQSRINSVQTIMTGLGWNIEYSELKKYLNKELDIQYEILGYKHIPNDWFDGHISHRKNWSATISEISDLNREISDLNKEISDLIKEASGLNKIVEEKTRIITEQEGVISALRTEISNFKDSTSWRITRPFRILGFFVIYLRSLWQILLSAVNRSGGIKSLIQKIVNVLNSEGLTGVKRRISFLKKAEGVSTQIISEENSYAEWVRRYETLDKIAIDNMKQDISSLASVPKISVVMPVYNAPLKYLKEAIESVKNQLYPNWELCIADDASTDHAIRDLLESYAANDTRIKVNFRKENGHISAASNSALELATGDFIALLDNDDLLPIHALYYVAKTIVDHPDVVLIYSDEDKINDSGVRYDPYFKCELNYELLLAQNMICHLGVYKRSVLKEIGGFRLGFEGAQDYDLALRVLESIQPKQVIHIPRILYHWRAIPGSTALGADEKDYAAIAARKVISEHLVRTGRGGIVSPAPEAPSLSRVRYPLPEQLPLVSIIIPTRDRADLLGMCLDSLLAKTTYPNYEVIIVDNGSTEAATQQLFAHQPKNKVKIIRDDTPFNYSRLNNLAVQHSEGEVICLMNNDIEILTPDWIEEMLSFSCQPDIGCVGARLWYPDGRLQHGGVILGIGGIAGHSFKYLPKGRAGYFSRAVLHQSMSAVTAACLMIRRDVWEQVNGLDENLMVAFNDVDFCLRVRKLGYRNVWTPYAEMNHHESASRGHETTPEKQARFLGEIQFMKERWSEELYNDPAYSKNLTLDHEDFSLAWPPRVNQLE
ncbi:glycosyltransferase [Aeromonas veronii]